MGKTSGLDWDWVDIQKLPDGRPMEQQTFQVNEELAVTIVHSLTEEHLADLCELFRDTWWAKARTLDQVRQMVTHCDLVVGLLDQASGRLIGFSRVLTDFVYRAMIYDVLVAEAYRNQGLGRRLIDCIVQHPSLQAVEQIALFCKPDMVPFYESWNFRDISDHVRLMICQRDESFSVF